MTFIMNNQVETEFNLLRLEPRIDIKENTFLNEFNKIIDVNFFINKHAIPIFYAQNEENKRYVKNDNKDNQILSYIFEWTLGKNIMGEFCSMLNKRHFYMRYKKI